MLIEIKPEDRDRLAALCHSQWAGWMGYLFGKSKKQPDGSVIIPADLVERWERQVGAPFADLSEKEKDSDRKEADKFIGLLEKRIEEVYRVTVDGKSHDFKNQSDAERFRKSKPGATMRKISEVSGGHLHPHDQDGAHAHPNLPLGGGHNHDGDGSHRHREGDPLEGAHPNEGQGYHEHPRAAAMVAESKRDPLPAFVPKLEDRPDFEVAAAVTWIRSEESKPIETVGWSKAERSDFKSEAIKEAGKRGLFSSQIKE